MNSSKRSIYPLFESVCILDGKIQNAEYHRNRFKTSFEKFYWESPSYDLFEDITIPAFYGTGKTKLRISYNRDGKRVVFSSYQDRNVKSLKIVIHNEIDYDLKFEDRTLLENLFQLRGECDDVLIIRNGLITDTSYANIALYDGENWITPSSCLLRGTKRELLLEAGFIKETEVTYKNIRSFEGFQLLNALLDFDPSVVIPIENIVD